MTKKSKSFPIVKFAISIAWDILDFFVGIGSIVFPIAGIPLGTVMDFVSVPVAYSMWGEKGLWAVWEVAEPTNMIDAIVPTMTIIAIYSHYYKD